MKKATLWLVSLLTFIMSIFCFSSCDIINALFDISIAGTYKLYSVTTESSTYYVGDTLDGITLTADTFSFEFKDDNTFVLSSTLEVAGETVQDSISGTWSKENSTLTLTATNSGTLSLTISGDTLTMVENGYTYVFKKQTTSGVVISAPSDTIVGTYKLKYATAEGITYYIGDTVPAGFVLTPDTMIFEIIDENTFKSVEYAEYNGDTSESITTIYFHEDNTYYAVNKITFNEESDESSVTGTWTKENDVITIYDSGEAVVQLTIKDNILTYKNDENNFVVYEKQ